MSCSRTRTPTHPKSGAPPRNGCTTNGMASRCRKKITRAWETVADLISIDFDSPTDLFLSQVLAAVELLDTGRYLLPEPHIIVDIVFNQALHVSIGITLRVCCDAIELGLQFRREVHFHDLRLATSQIDGQASEQQAQMNFYAPSLNASSSPL